MSTKLIDGNIEYDIMVRHTKTIGTGNESELIFDANGTWLYFNLKEAKKLVTQITEAVALLSKPVFDDKETPIN